MGLTEISLAAARVNAGFTQAEVAKYMHISNKTLSNWETGASEPSFADLNTLSSLYRVPIDCIRLPIKSALSE